MSHQTGIKASDDLKEFLATSKDGSCRLIKICISDEKLELSNSEKPDGTWEQDFDNLVLPQLEEKQPCYIVYRLDTKNSMGYDWIFMAWSPDFSAIREKMLYAGTRSTIKTEFGTGTIKEELFGTVMDDLTLEGYKKHLVSKASAAPLTLAEEELEILKQTETRAEISVDTKHQTMSGLSFPISDEAAHALIDYKEGKLTYVQFKLNLDEESIELGDTGNFDTVEKLKSKVPSDSARYHLFAFKHTHEGDFLKLSVFVYSMPGYNCPIKERMLYSSCKNPFISQIEQHLELEISKKIEIDSPEELSEDYLYDEIHPKKNIATRKFDKPKGPAKRGPRKLLKNTDAQ